ncbi:hypothetical protein D9M69_507260 [compost metagenome]
MRPTSCLSMLRASALKSLRVFSSLRASRAKRSPFAVRRKPPRPRSHSVNPSRISSVASCSLIVDWPTPSAPCAAETPPASTMARKMRISRMSKSVVEVSMQERPK